MSSVTLRGSASSMRVMRSVSSGDMPGGGLVRSRSRGLRRERDADLELALLAVGEASRPARQAVSEAHDLPRPRAPGRAGPRQR